MFHIPARALDKTFKSFGFLFLENFEIPVIFCVVSHPLSAHRFVPSPLALTYFNLTNFSDVLFFFVFLTFSHRWSSCFDTIFGIQYVGEQQQCPFIIYSIIMSIISLFYFFCFFYFYCLLLYLFEYTMRVFFFLLFFFLRWWRPKTVNRLRITHPIILVHLANSSKPYRHRY